jgi:cystathionine gamma-lyase
LSRAIQATGVEVTYLDFEAAGEEGIRASIRPDTRVSLYTFETAFTG